MIATIISDDNISAFIPGYAEKIEDDDLFIGVYDETDDTACGALMATRISDDTVRIVDMHVSEEYRRQGAGTAMITYLQEFAYEAGIETLLCTHEREYDIDPVSAFLEKNGFAEDEDKTLNVYSVTVTDLKDHGIDRILADSTGFTDIEGKKITSLSEADPDTSIIVAPTDQNGVDLMKHVSQNTLTKEREIVTYVWEIENTIE